MTDDTPELFTDAKLVIGGKPIDGRTIEARRWKSLASDLAAQLKQNPTPAERLMLMQAATLSALCERFTADLIEGKDVADQQENYRRNCTALGAILVKLGLAAKSRDITKRDRTAPDDFGAALIEANSTNT